MPNTKGLSLRLKPEQYETLEKLKEGTGEATAAKAIMLAVRQHLPLTAKLAQAERRIEALEAQIETYTAARDRRREAEQAEREALDDLQP